MNSHQERRPSGPKVITGGSARALLGIGGIVLLFAGGKLLAETTPSAAVAFVAGVGCGYIGPLWLRLVGQYPDHLSTPRWLRATVLPAFLAPFVVAAGVFHFMSIDEGRAFLTGGIANLFLGLSLLEDAPSRDKEN